MIEIHEVNPTLCLFSKRDFIPGLSYLFKHCRCEWGRIFPGVSLGFLEICEKMKQIKMNDLISIYPENPLEDYTDNSLHGCGSWDEYEYIEDSEFEQDSREFFGNWIANKHLW